MSIDKIIVDKHISNDGMGRLLSILKRHRYSMQSFCRDAGLGYARFYGVLKARRTATSDFVNMVNEIVHEKTGDWWVCDELNCSVVGRLS